MILNVLIVDDSEVMRSILKRVLKLSGFELGEIYEAGDGKEALSKLEQYWIDIVLSDINMPVMNGVELLKTIKESEEYFKIPVIIVSTEGRNEKIEEIINLGAAGYITKPFRPEDIRNTICKSLGVEINGNLAQEPEDSDF
jgi:two-component system, chemotaxis family, chemotaxis protein CheY